MQTQKPDETRIKRDMIGRNERPDRKNKAKLGQTAMHGAHCGHAGTPIASHLQHDYLPVIEGRDMPRI